MRCRCPRVRLRLRGLMVMTATLAVYFWSYRTLVNRDLFHNSPVDRAQVEAQYPGPYRLGAIVFAPANQLDRLIRPHYWASPACVY